MGFQLISPSEDLITLGACETLYGDYLWVHYTMFSLIMKGKLIGLSESLKTNGAFPLALRTSNRPGLSHIDCKTFSAGFPIHFSRLVERTAPPNFSKVRGGAVLVLYSSAGMWGRENLSYSPSIQGPFMLGGYDFFRKSLIN